MPDNRSGALSVDYPRSERWFEDILDRSKIPGELCRYSRQANLDLAQVLLGQGGDRLPQWVGATRAGVYQTVPPVLGHSGRRMVEQWSCPLITVDRADNVPGFSWGAGAGRIP
jgi:hypothetical protein